REHHLDQHLRIRAGAEGEALHRSADGAVAIRRRHAFVHSAQRESVGEAGRLPALQLVGRAQAACGGPLEQFGLVEADAPLLAASTGAMRSASRASAVECTATRSYARSWRQISSTSGAGPSTSRV